MNVQSADQQDLLLLTVLKKETTIQLTALLLYHQVFFDDPPWLPKLLGFQNALRVKANSSSFLWFEPTRAGTCHLPFAYGAISTSSSIMSCIWFGRHFPLEGVTRKSMQKNRRMDSKTHEIPFVEIETSQCAGNNTKWDGNRRKYVPIYFGLTTEFGIPNLSFWVTTTAGLQGAFRNFKRVFPYPQAYPWLGSYSLQKKKGPNVCDTINGGSCHSALTMSWLQWSYCVSFRVFLCLPHVCLAFLPLLNDFGDFGWTCVCVFDFFIHCLICFLSLMHTPSMLWLCLRSTNWLNEFVHFWNQSRRFPPPEPVLSAVPSCHVPAGLWTSAK